MDDVINNIKEKLSTDNLVEMMKDAKVIDNHRIKEEDVRRTLEKMDPSNLIDVGELAAKLSEITKEAAAKEDHRFEITERSIATAFYDDSVKRLKEVDEITDDTVKKDDTEKEDQSSINTTEKSKPASMFGNVLRKSQLEVRNDNEFHDNVTGFLD